MLEDYFLKVMKGMAACPSTPGRFFCQSTIRHPSVSAEGAWQPGSIEILGTAPIAPASPDVFPSDHFGLVAVIEAR